MEPFSIDLTDVPDDGFGEFRNKNPPNTTIRRDIIDRGKVLTVDVSLALLGHGTLTPGGTDASLLVFDFRFNSTKSTRRFVDATVTIEFRDLGGDRALDPVVRTIAPEDEFSIDLGVESWDVEQRLGLGLTAGVEQAKTNLNYDTQRKGKSATEHCVKLLGKKRVLGKDFGRKNAVVWSMEEDPKTKAGIPTLLRAAVILERERGRTFAFDVGVEENIDFVSGLESRVRTFFGAEHSVQVDDLQIDPASPSHVLEAEDPAVVAFAEKIVWTRLQDLARNLQDDAVLVTMRKLLLSGPVEQTMRGQVHMPGTG